MVAFERHNLPNGLTVLVHRDTTTPIAAMNLLYHVGAKDEDPDKTGFAHLFEHLMFEGSVNIPRFDEPLERVGGQNNAFTNNDFTNFYLSVPVQNLETAFWLESDRMLGLDFSAEKVEIQKQVVAEEYRQRYLNQPYGDLWLLLRPLAFRVHPYRWPTIGKDISHIEKAGHDDIMAFFERHYAPGNAILAIAGNVDPDSVFRLAERWFGPIARPYTYQRDLNPEPVQTEARISTVTRKVPMHAVYKMFHTCERGHPGFILTDILSDIFSRGDSSRLYRELVKKRKLFQDISCFVSGELEHGLMVFGGKVSKGVPPEEADEALFSVIRDVAAQGIADRELEKIINQMETTRRFIETRVTEKAYQLSFYQLLGDAARWQEENRRMKTVTPAEIRELAQGLFSGEHCSTLHYLAENEASSGG